MHTSDRVRNPQPEERRRGECAVVKPTSGTHSVRAKVVAPKQILTLPASF